MERYPTPEADTRTAAVSARSYACWTVFFLSLALVTAFFAGFLPIAPVVVATGSMEPSIGVGDVVLICRTDPANLETGDVIQYQGDGCTVIHRIVEVDGGSFITQGDANNAPDLWPVAEDQILGRMILTIPDAGKLTLWLHEKLSS